ncbi:MAG: cytochrome c biogenesis protein ResB [Elainellaceae cyanobacterium]
MPPKAIRFLGSIRLAVPLIVAIAIILIGATFYESNVGSATVQREIYKSAWFGGLMFLLAVNLGVSTLSRYPWRGPRKVGFAITHWGLIIIIAGSAAVIHLSTEGMLLVRTDSGPGNQIRVEGDLLEVASPDQTRRQTDIFVKPDGSVHPSRFAGLSLLGYSDRATKTVRFVEGDSAKGPAAENLAVQLRLRSDRMGQTLERWLALAPLGYGQMDIGPARLELRQAADEVELKQFLSPPSSQSTYGTLQLGDRTIDIEKKLSQSVSLPGGITAEIVAVWPDFRLTSGKPASASNAFRNPAVQVNVSQDETQERWFVFAKPGLPPVRSGDAIDLEATYAAPDTTASDYFRVVAAPDSQLFYAALSSKGFSSGELRPGDVIAPGWADFQISLANRLDHAQVRRQVVPITPAAAGAGANEGFPALQVAIAAGGRGNAGKGNAGKALWLPWGEPMALDTPQGEYFAAFAPKLLQLPFYVKLDDFIVERNEGSESVAMWTSRITLFDPKTDTATQRSVWMNHPTWFRGWKLAQASWNPGDLKQSTLQLKREPWWVTALTWIGSLMVVVGVGTMFYGPAVMKRSRGGKPAPHPEVPSEDAVEDAIAEPTPQLVGAQTRPS